MSLSHSIIYRIYYLTSRWSRTSNDVVIFHRFPDITSFTVHVSHVTAFATLRMTFVVPTTRDLQYYATLILSDSRVKMSIK